MSYGKLGVIKSFGETPTFAILDKDDKPDVIIPNINEWLMERVGKIISFSCSDIYWTVADIEEKGKI